MYEEEWIEGDNPTIELQHLPKGEDIGNYMVVSFYKMLKMNKLTEWESLFKQTENKDECIKDDMVMNNSEMEPYKLFYLKTYYFNILKYSQRVYVL